MKPEMRSAPLAATESEQFTGVKIFSATLAEQRALLGETVTQWLRVNPQVEVVDTVVTQSSDSRFHCLTLVLFFRRSVEPPQSAQAVRPGGTTS